MEKLIERLENQINVTPTGELRNLLCDVNIMLQTPSSILDEMIEYIEQTEVTIENEWGSCKDLKELIRNKEMPKLYDTLITLNKSKHER